MKRCPKCDFGFVNFHKLCDFDGTELVDDAQTLPVFPAVSALAAATQSRFRRLVKSPVFWTLMALAGVLSSLLLLVYYDATLRPNSTARNPADQDSVVSVSPSVQLPPPMRTRIPANGANEVSTGSVVPSPIGRGQGEGVEHNDRATSRSAIGKPKARKDTSTRAREALASRSRTRLRASPAIRNQQSRPEIALQRQPKDKVVQREESALQRDSKENATRKESKLTATLKSTWRILKKPFKF